MPAYVILSDNRGALPPSSGVRNGSGLAVGSWPDNGHAQWQRRVKCSP